jgi:gluconate 2-dehydrogenase gamma chain
MTISKADWPVVGAPVDPDDETRLFFTEHEWETVDAACARIIPTDHDPGAREARAVRFIDRYLSGIDYIYAAADGSGFLQMSGKLADAWRGRISDMQRTYREGLRALDALADDHHGKPFKELGEEDQDRILEHLSGAPKPAPVSFGRGQEVRSFLQGTFDEGLPFFDALALHTRQGFYSDPVYGGNKGHVGWQVIGFPGPKTLKETNDLTFSVQEHFEHDYDWRELVPRLRDKDIPEVEGS